MAHSPSLRPVRAELFLKQDFSGIISDKTGREAVARDYAKDNGIRAITPRSGNNFFVLMKKFTLHLILCRLR